MTCKIIPLPLTPFLPVFVSPLPRHTHTHIRSVSEGPDMRKQIKGMAGFRQFCMYVTVTTRRLFTAQ